MLDGVAERARDWFLACYFVEGLRAPLPRDNLIGHRKFFRFSFETEPVSDTSSRVSRGLLHCRHYPVAAGEGSEHTWLYPLQKAIGSAFPVNRVLRVWLQSV